jgi:DNA-binding NtrC family response regulator
VADDTRATGESTAVLPGQEAEAAGQAPRLVIFSGGRSSIVELEAGKSYVLGRASDAEVSIPDASISRRHLEVRCGDEQVVAVDLGSSNGTRLNGQRLVEPTALTSGDILSLGSTEVAYQASTRASAQRLAGRDELVRALGQEIDRAVNYGLTVTVLLLRAPGGDAATVTEALLRRLRVTDRAGDLGGGLVGALLVDMSARARSEGVARLVDPGWAAGAAVATWPEDGADAASLLAAAEAALALAVPGELLVARDTAVRLDVGDGVGALFADGDMLKRIALLERVAATDLPVLLAGETGVGKELFARAVHIRSRAAGPFVAINCAALPETLAERELFGHVKGAFTGADSAAAGAFQAADRGTLFLDEIGEMSLAVQAKLLRALDAREVTPLGATRPQPIDVRLVAATNRDLAAEVAAGRFREDLFYRIKGARIEIPPLRRRPRDIPLLAQDLADRAARRMGHARAELTAQVLYLLARHPWPGNVRELRAVIELAVATAGGAPVQDWMLPPELGGAEPADPTDAPRFRPIAEQVAELEKVEIARALEAAGGVRTRAAALLSMPLRTFHAKVRQYGLGDKFPAGK